MLKKGRLCLLVVSLGFILFLIGTTPVMIPAADVGGMSHSPSEDFTLSNEIEAVNPVAMDDTYSTDEDTALVVDAISGVLANDTDPDGDLLACQLLTAPSYGSLDFNVDGSFTYTPNPGWHGVDSFEYQALDGMLTDSATVIITVNPVNDPPVAVDDFYAIDEDTILDTHGAGMAGVLANDYDADGDSLEFIIMAPPSHGDIIPDPDGNFLYTPDADFWGTDSFTYYLFDGSDTSNIATVTITVNPVNDSPVAEDDVYTIDEDTILYADIAAGVLANDSDVDGDPLEAYFVELPSNGILFLNPDGSFTYTPDADFWGVDSFTYLAYDGFDASNIATVTIYVNPVNDAPVAVDDFYVTDEDIDLSTHGSGIAGVLANDYDADGDSLEFILMTYPSHGDIIPDPDGNFLYTPDADFWGTDSFTYYLFDGSDTSLVATVTITINPVNDLPVTVDDAYTMDEDGTLQVGFETGVLANDSDVDGDSLVAHIVELPSNGMLSLNPDGSFTYTPDPDFWGVDSFTYIVDDGFDVGDIATVTITVNAVNDAPVAVDDFYSTNEDTDLSTYGAGIAGVLANDYDIEGDMLTAQLISGPSHGSLILNADGSFTYIPNPDWFGEDSFEYEVSDEELSDTGTAYITVNSVNDAPVAHEDDYQMDEDGVLSIPAPGLLSNDYDVDGDSFYLDDWSYPEAGYLVVYEDGAFDFIPDPDWNGIATFEYWVYDGLVHSNVVTVMIIVHPVNDAPIALDDSYTTDEDTDLSTYGAGMAGVLANDYDADGDSLEFLILDYPSHGAFIPDIYGDFLYIPDPDFWGTDSFTYYLFDGVLTSNIAMVTITVNPVNDAPVAHEDEYFMDEDGELIIYAPGLLSNDYDVDGDSFYLDDWSYPEAGYLVVYEDGAFDFIPDPDWNGVAVFEYWVYDGLVHSNIVTVTINVFSVNDAPLADDDNYSTNEDTPLSVPAPGVLNGDTDVENDPLTAFLETGPARGILILNADGSFDYFPDPDFFGIDAFTYMAHDGEGGSNIATVTITVNSVNDAPVAFEDEYQIDEDGELNIPAPGLLINDYDIDGDFIFVDDWSDPAFGVLWVDEDGSFTYIPDPDWHGIAVFEYWVFDGLAHSNVVTVTIFVNSVNDAPVALDDFYTTDEDFDLSTYSASLSGVLANDFDVDGNPLEAILMEYPLHGYLAFGPDGNFEYIPDADFWGTDWFTYYIFDGLEASDLAVVTITVNSVNDAPVAFEDEYQIDEDGELNIPAPGLLENDYDIEGDFIFVDDWSDPAFGVLWVDEDGSFTYIPDPDWHGIATFEYWVFDGLAHSNVVTVTIIVNPVDDPPVAVDDYVATDEDTPITIDIMANDYDIEGDPFRLVGYGWSSAELHGVLTTVDVGGTLMIRYTPDSNWHGSAWFFYNIGTTGSTHLESAYVYITVNSVEDAPVAVDDDYAIDEDGVLQVDAASGVLANDYDGDGDSLTLQLISSPSHGSLLLNADGSFTYTPDADWYGNDMFEYEVSDGDETDTATVTIIVNPVDDPPVAVDDYVATDEDTPITIDIMANDYDIEGDPFRLVGYGWSSAELHGVLTTVDVGGILMIRYTPDSNWHGSAWFFYNIGTTGSTHLESAYVYITVNPVNDGPVAVDDYVILDEDTSIIIDFMGNDYDVDDTFDWYYVQWTPSEINGELELVHNYEAEPGVFRTVLRYTPDPNWFGSSSSISYGIEDTFGEQVSAQIFITVNPVNDAPVGVDDEYTIDEDTSLDLAAPGLLGNDYDIDGDAITLDVIAVPVHGSGSIGADGSFSYTPNPNWYGTDSMTYQLFDGTDYSGIVTVTITVNPINDAPVGVDDEYTIDEDGSLNVAAPGVLVNDYDVDGDSLTAVLVDPPHGSGSFGPNGALNYNPPANWHGVTTLTYKVFDGTEYSGIVTVTIIVNSVNDAPVAVDDYVVLDEDTSVIIDFMGNDYDVDDTFNWRFVSWDQSEINGELELVQNYEVEPGVFRMALRYTPDPDWFGSSSSISYGIQDSFGAQSSAQIFITVNSVNDAPVAVDDYVVTDEDTPVIIDYMGNDYDIEGHAFDRNMVGWYPLEIHGEWEYVWHEVEPGVFRWTIQYTPDPNWHGTITPLQYTVRDSLDAVSNLAYIYITVNSVNDAPVGVDDSYTIDEDTSLNLPAPGVLSNDYDVDGDSITLDFQTFPQHGTWSIGSNGFFNYNPPADWYGTDSFTYRVFDGTEYSGIVTVTITVNPVNDAPVAVDDYIVTDEDTPIIIDYMGNDYDVDGDAFDRNMVGWYPLEIHGEWEYVWHEVEPGVFRWTIQYTPDPNWHGTITPLQYTVRDSLDAVSNLAYIHITVNPVNDAPVGVDDSYTIDEDTSLNLPAPGVLSNDYDVDGDSITLDFLTYPQHGEWIIGSNGLFNYYPPADWYGTDSFTYRVFDGTEYSEIVTVTVTVNPVNDAPVAVDDYVVIDEDTSVIIDFMANDYDVDDDFDWYMVAWTLLDLHGEADLLFNYEVEPGMFRTVITYTPDPNWHGSTSTIHYEIWDSSGAVSSTAYIYITVNPVNDAPVGVDDFYSIDEDLVLQVGVDAGILFNDSDVEGDVLQALLESGPSNGALTLHFDGSFTYTPDTDFWGTDSFTYRASDGVEYSNVATVTITVNPVNDPSVAVNDYVTTDEDTPIIIDVMANDYDVEGDAFNIFGYGWSPPQPYGSLAIVTVDGVKMIKYTPNPNWHGSAWFIYDLYTPTVQWQSRAYVYITVNSVPDAPIAEDDFYTVNEDTTLTIDTVAGVLANDSDGDGDPFTIQLVSGTSHGILVFNTDGSFTYTPDLNWFGDDSFIYEASDGTLTDIATVTITVNPVDDNSVAVDDYVTTDEDTPIIIDVMANDYDVEGDAFNIFGYGWSPPQPYGSLAIVTVDGVKMIKYTPNPNWHGSAWFIYDLYTPTVQWQSRAYVYITVNPVNDAPVAADDAFTVEEDTNLQTNAASGVLANDSDVDGNSLQAVLVSGPANGMLTLNADGSFIYVPGTDFWGTDSFTYYATDGLLDSSVVTVTISVNAVNDAPVAADDAYTCDEDTVLQVDEATGVLANDVDVDGDALTVQLVSGPSHGSLVFYDDGSFTYTPESNWFGEDYFVYEVLDGVLVDTATVTITVNSVNDAPVAVDDAYATDEDTILQAELITGLLANDSDIDGDVLTAVVVSGPSHGLLSLNPDGSFSYTPDANWFGVDSFVYEVSDGGLTDTAAVTITVLPVNDAPVGVNDSYTIDEDTSLTLPAPGVLSNDYDVDGNALTAAFALGPSHGVLTLNTDGSFSYTPDADWFGVDSFVYEVSDGELTDSATVTITVNSVNDAPVAVNDTYSTLEDVILIVAPPGVLANDFDVDGDPLATTLLDMPLHGIVLLEPDGAFTYVPDPDYYGFDTFTYQVFDGTEYSDIATVIITVIYVNTPPTAYNDAYTTEAGVPLVVEAPGVLANDVDVDVEDILEALLIDSPMHGTVVLNPDGSFTYIPDTAWSGVDTFTYNVFDGREYSNIAVVTLTVIDVTPPVTTIQFFGVEGEYDWYHSDVEVILTATDDCSGVASTLYSLNGSTWMPYTGPFVLSDPGEVTVYYYSTDNAGNVEDIKTATIKISKPTRSFVTGGGWICDSERKGHFTFVVKYKCGVLRGFLLYSYREDGYKYVIKSTHWFGMAIDGNHALLEGKAKIFRYNYETRDWDCLKDFYFRVEVWDNGKCKADIFQISIFDESGQLFHEAGLDPLGVVRCGNIRIHHRGTRCGCYHWFRKWYP